MTKIQLLIDMRSPDEQRCSGFNEYERAHLAAALGVHLETVFTYEARKTVGDLLAEFRGH